MKKKKCHGLRIVVVLVMVFTFLIEPAGIYAEDKISNETFCEQYMYYMQDGDFKGYYNYVKSIDGKYQENGLKIYCALDGKTRTFKKEGKYSIVVGGKTNKKDEGNVKFVAPSTGTYKFTFALAKNVARDSIIIKQKGNGNIINAKVDYSADIGGPVKHSKLFLLANEPSCSYHYSQDVGYLSSNMDKITGKVYLKKGQYIRFNGRSEFAQQLPLSKYVEPEDAYNFAGYDLTIKKVDK